ncbi:hypothetical protein [Filimonas effusa]|uniref:Uncharacterized protein n=1 Tax=Filimonas effusa TaxID=2508721 RepID=A0A4V1MA32_9BACT|nr:hypothetical protein [Filimonas effusa]RXK83764.1 hypothetical protein ESB13_16955 [Filimonas effusa]
MKRYADLSANFRSSKQSKESIAQLYAFLDETGGAQDKTSLLVRSQVYSLLGYHQKAYDIFVAIADKSNRKDISRLFEMEQLAKSHQDNFALKRKPAPIQHLPELTLNDFVKEDNSAPDEVVFAVSRRNIILGKVFDDKPLLINLERNIALEDVFPQLLTYIKWLGSCKAELIDYYNRNFENNVNEAWYNYLDIFGVRITVAGMHQLTADITCGDEIAQDHLLDISFDGKRIVSMSYDG